MNDRWQNCGFIGAVIHVSASHDVAFFKLQRSQGSLCAEGNLVIDLLKPQKLTTFSCPGPVQSEQPAAGGRPQRFHDRESCRTAFQIVVKKLHQVFPTHAVKILIVAVQQFQQALACKKRIHRIAGQTTVCSVISIQNVLKESLLKVSSPFWRCFYYYSTHMRISTVDSASSCCRRSMRTVQ